MLKITRLLDLALRVLGTNDNEVVGGNSDIKANEIIKNLFKSKKSKNIKSQILTCMNIGVTGESTFLTLGTGKTFN